jgi:hypothetical protein
VRRVNERCADDYMLAGGEGAGLIGTGRPGRAGASGPTARSSAPPQAAAGGAGRRCTPRAGCADRRASRPGTGSSASTRLDFEPGRSAGRRSWGSGQP